MCKGPPNARLEGFLQHGCHTRGEAAVCLLPRSTHIPELSMLKSIVTDLTSLTAWTGRKARSEESRQGPAPRQNEGQWSKRGHRHLQSACPMHSEILVSKLPAMSVLAFALQLCQAASSPWHGHAPALSRSHGESEGWMWSQHCRRSAGPLSQWSCQKVKSINLSGSWPFCIMLPMKWQPGNGLTHRVPENSPQSLQNNIGSMPATRWDAQKH